MTFSNSNLLSSTTKNWSLHTVFLEILYGCNYHCSYCYIGEQLNHIQPIVPEIDRTFGILDLLSSAQINELVLLGGEPSIHPKFESICYKIAELNFPNRGMVSNGTGIDIKTGKVLKDCNFWVDISYRGHDSVTFDDLAGKKGAFDEAVNALQILADLKVPFGIEFDCLPQNYFGLYDLVEHLSELELKPKQIQLHRILPMGDASNGQFVLSIDQWREVFSHAKAIKQDFEIPVVFEDGFPMCLVNEDIWEFITPCACGYSLITIDPMGNARYCSGNTSTAGNILTDGIDSIWEKKLHSYREESRLPEACQSCDLLAACRGGCSGSCKSDTGYGFDLFSDHFKPIRLDKTSVPKPKIIMRQQVLDADQVSNPKR